MSLEPNLFTSKLWCPMQILLQSLFRQIATNLHRNASLWKWVYLVSSDSLSSQCVAYSNQVTFLKQNDIVLVNEILSLLCVCVCVWRDILWSSEQIVRFLLAMALKSGTLLSHRWIAINVCFRWNATLGVKWKWHKLFN